MLATPDMMTEAGRAGAYAVIGGLLLKAAQAFLRRAEGRRRDALAEMDASLHAGASIRQELRKENEQLRERIGLTEKKVQRLEEEVAQLQDRLENEEQLRKDAEAELRLMRKSMKATS